MPGGDSSSSQCWGMEEDEVVFLKQVTLCPDSPLCREAGANLWVPQLSCPRWGQVSSQLWRCPKSKVICLKIKIKKNKIGIRHLWEARRGMTRAGVPGCQSHAWILPLRVHAGLGIPGATQTYCQSLSQSGGAAGQFLANGHPILVLHPGPSRALCHGQHSQSVPLPDSLQLWASASPAPPGAFQRQPGAVPAACSSPCPSPACSQPASVPGLGAAL